MKHPDNIIEKEMLVKDEYYIWNQCTTVILLRFVEHHSEYAIKANKFSKILSFYYNKIRAWKRF